MGNVVVHQFYTREVSTGKEVISTRMGTLQAITEANGLVLIEGTDVTVDSSRVNADGFTDEHFKA